MSWELITNSSGDIVWFASSTSGTIDPFGEVLVQVITQSTGLNSRVTADQAQTGRFTLFWPSIFITSHSSTAQQMIGCTTSCSAPSWVV